MTRDDDARLDGLLAHLGEGDTRDLFRMLLQRGMQELIDGELTATIGAELHERTDTRTNQRNGARSRMLSTPAGDIELRIPKLRVGSFFPSLLEPRRRVDQARARGIRGGRQVRDRLCPSARRLLVHCMDTRS
jgi:putative transposase